MDLKETFIIKQNTTIGALSKSDEIEPDFTGEDVKLNGLQYKVMSKMNSGFYRLLSLNSIPEHGAIAKPIQCRSCGEIFWFEDADIPDKEKYCPVCNSVL